MVNGGQLEAGLLEVLSDEAPFAMALLIEGLLVVMKLPQIAGAVSTSIIENSMELWVNDGNREETTYS